MTKKWSNVNLPGDRKIDHIQFNPVKTRLVRTTGDADLFTDHVDFAVERIAPVVVKLGNVNIKKQVPVLA